LAIEITDWIAIAISVASLVFAVIAFRSSRKASISEAALEFSNELHDHKFLGYRDKLYERFCAKNRDAQALKNDPQYALMVDHVYGYYSIIIDHLKQHPNFKKEERDLIFIRWI
jgi:hypothetical protein